ncbi:hypothetical protein [Paracoccus sp. S1E-3]|uniref:hypothetical protein n=1 Tax=Paracoccus sp. S1E-3 TaxID=2756130 RepID=UPI0015EEF12A|nr:hypothetical protein [Paracoccus sp. S1E-3]MBA4489588.1 hypothetical protein [Paracoccus sp. S1E-3]
MRKGLTPSDGMRRAAFATQTTLRLPLSAGNEARGAQGSGSKAEARGFCILPAINGFHYSHNEWMHL